MDGAPSETWDAWVHSVVARAWEEPGSSGEIVQTRDLRVYVYYGSKRAPDVARRFGLDGFQRGVEVPLVHVAPGVCLGVSEGSAKRDLQPRLFFCTLAVGVSRVCDLTSNVPGGAGFIFAAPVDAEPLAVYRSLLAALWQEPDDVFVYGHGELLAALALAQAQAPLGPDFWPAALALLAVLPTTGANVCGAGAGSAAGVSRGALRWAAAGQLLTAAESEEKRRGGGVAAAVAPAGGAAARRRERARGAAADEGGAEAGDGRPARGQVQPIEAMLLGLGAFTSEPAASHVVLLSSRTAWCAARYALRRTYEADVTSLIPRWQSLRHAPLLHALGAIPGGFGGARLLPPLPAAQPQLTQGAQEIAGARMRAVPPSLQRSDSLLQRDAEWERAVRAADRTLNRHYVARDVLEREQDWAEKWLASCRRCLTLAPGAGVDASGALACLAEAENEVTSVLQKLLELLSRAEADGLEDKVRNLAEQGRELRQRTHLLTQRFGADVGRFASSAAGTPQEGYCVSTAVGLHDVPTPGTRDGLASGDDGLPHACVSAPRAALCLASRDWLFVEPSTHHLRRLDADTDRVETLVGRQGIGHADGPVGEARLRNPAGLLQLPNGLVLVADSGNHCLRQYEPEHNNRGPAQLTTLTSMTHAGGHRDAILRMAEFQEPTAMALAGKNVIVAQKGALRLVSDLWQSPHEDTPPGGWKPAAVSTLCGVPYSYGYRDGSAKDALLTAPMGLATAPWSEDLIFFTDRHCIRSFYMRSKRVETVAGLSGRAGGFGNGEPLKSTFFSPQGLCFLPGADPPVLLVADTQNHVIRMVLFSQIQPRDKYMNVDYKPVRVDTFAGRPGRPAWRDGETEYARFGAPAGLAVSPEGAILVTEAHGHKLRWLWPVKMRAHAMRMYGGLQGSAEKLAKQMTDLAYECDLGTMVTEDAMRSARSHVLVGHAAATACIYKQSIAAIMENMASMPRQDADSVFRLLIALAPTPALLAIALDQVSALLPSGVEVWMEAARGAALARLKPALQDSDPARSVVTPKAESGTPVERSVVVESDLVDWVTLAASHPEAVGTDVVSEVLLCYCGAPSIDLVALCVLGTLRGGGGAMELARFAPLAASLVEAMKADATRMFSDSEKKTPDKILRVALRQWVLLLNALQGNSGKEIGVCRVADYLPAAAALLHLGLVAFSDAMDITRALLAGACRGLSNWIAKPAPSGGRPQPIFAGQAVYDIMQVVGCEAIARLGQGDALRILMHRDALDRSEDDAGTPEAAVEREHAAFECAQDATLLYLLLERALPQAPVDDVSAWLLRRAPWAPFVVWAADEAPRAAKSGAVDSFAPLRSAAQGVASAFLAVTVALEDGTARASLVDLAEAEEQMLAAPMKRIGLLKRFGAALRDRAVELRELRADLEAVESACEGRLPPEAGPAMAVAIARAELYRFSVRELRSLVGTGPADDAHEELPPLPSSLMKATAWLRTHTVSRAFDVAWAQASVAVGDAADFDAQLLACSRIWGELPSRMLSGSLTFGELECYLPALLDEVEMTLFARSAPAAKEASFNFAAPPIRGPRVVAEGCRDVVSRFAVLSRAKSGVLDVLHTVEQLGHLVKQKSSSVQEAAASVKELCVAVESIPDWGRTLVGELPRFVSMTTRVDQRLYDLNGDLIGALHDHAGFLAWLAESFPPPDSDFTSAVEMALGKPEMECPPELWIERSGDRPGHPDEQLLSTLTAVRQALHKYLYRKDGTDFGHFPTLTAAVDCLADVSGNAEALTSSLRECASLHLAFVELLSDDADSGAIGRLLNLQRPEWQAQWRFVVSGAVSELTLAYSVPRSTGALVACQTLAEMLDFQSVVVLARNHGQEASSVDQFVTSFGWAQDLARAYTALASIGHLEYAHHESSTPLMSAPEVLQSEAHRLQEEACRWAAYVDGLRRETPALNWFTMRQLRHFLVDLHSKAGEGSSSLAALLAGVIDGKDARHLAAKCVRDAWHKARLLREQSGCAYAKLADLATALTAAVPLSVRVRRVVASQNFQEAGSAASLLEKGISVCVGAQPLQVALSVFAREGMLPEWPLLLCCSGDTSLEEVSSLVHRWRTLKVPQGFFCLCGVDALGASISQQLSKELMCRTAATNLYLDGELASSLLLISRSQDHHLVRQFSRTVVPPASAAELRSLGEALDGRFSLGCVVLTSRVPGTGKTFAVRARAAKANATRIHLPLHRTLGVGDLLALHGDALSAHGLSLLHLDVVSEPTDESAKQLDVLLLGFCLFGTLFDSAAGRRWAWDGRATSICVELTGIGGSDLISTFAALRLLDVVASRSAFCASPTELSNVLCAKSPAAAPVDREETVRATGLVEAVVVVPADDDSLASDAGPAKPLAAALIDGEDPAGAAGPTISAPSDEGFILVDGPSEVSAAFVPPARAVTEAADGGSADIRLGAEQRENIAGNKCLTSDAATQPTDLMASPECTRQARVPEVFEEELRLTGDVQLVCRALREREQTFGCGPDFCSKDVEKLFPLSGAECFDLLHRAVQHRLGARDVSLSSLLGFVRVVAWQLREFTPDSSPVRKYFDRHLLEKNDDRRQDHSMKSSAVHDENQLRGELVAYVCRTAADFTFRQERLEPARRKDEWLQLTYSIFTKKELMGKTVEWLQRAPFESNGRPVYRAGSALDPTYVHFRPSTVKKRGEWVLEASGSAPRTSEGEDLAGRWAKVGDSNSFEETTAAVLSHDEALRECAGLVDRDEQGFMNSGAPGELVLWDETNHEVLLVKAKPCALRFLAQDPKLLRRHVHPGLWEHLEKKGLRVAEDIHRMGAPHNEILCEITGVRHDGASASKLLAGGFCLTGDGLLKLLAVFVRAQCGIPVVLQGECGTGKTHMLRFLCKWMRAELHVLDVHGGTTAAEIEDIFKMAEAALLASESCKEVFVFLDEVNTCAHMDLICEAICQRSLHGRPIDPRIRTLAAVNPVRVRSKPLEAPGLTFHSHTGGGATDALKDLVYRVHPVPPGLREFLFDFGGLPADTEMQYIRSMTAAQLPDTDGKTHAVVARLLRRAQAFVREAEGDHSAVSLRDVHRALRLALWFVKYAGAVKPGASGKTSSRSPLSVPVVLGLAHVFYFRLPSAEQRADLMRLLRLEVTTLDGPVETGFEWLKPVGVMDKVVLSTQKSLCSKLVVEDGVAMNAALMENLYVALVCICNRVPVFIVGKPGSSKTLTLQVLASNLQGDQSPNPFWKRFPALYIFSYQCSPFSTAVGIKHQHEIACNYQRKSQRTLTVLLLDEVGLAEHSPDMPLKVLHGILANPKVAIVGLSNWTLDAAKMNRAVCLQRPTPSPADLHLTGVHLLGQDHASEGATGPPPPAAEGAGGELPLAPPSLQRSRSGASRAASWLEPLSRAYHLVYTRQKGRDFIGMRDYYQTVQLLWRELGLSTSSSRGSGAAATEGEGTQAPETLALTAAILCRAICRNFGGREDLLAGALEAFGQECFGEALSEALQPTAASLIQGNLADANARHLMLLTSHGAALPLIFAKGLVPLDAVVLVGSAFPDDRHDLYLIQHVNRVKSAMAAGEVVVLWNLDNIYESLYDVLNQRYIVRSSGGHTRKSLRLAIGARSQLCPVEDGFRVVVVVERDHAYEDLDLPLLNRFEKCLLEPGHLLSARQADAAAQLGEWMRAVLDESGMVDVGPAFCGVSASTVDSLALEEVPDLDADPSSDDDQFIRAKQRLAALAAPFAVLQSPKLQAAAPEYSAHHADLLSLHASLPRPCSGGLSLVVVLTQTSLCALAGPWTSIQLSEVASEARLVASFSEFFGGRGAYAEASTLLIQCDPQVTPQVMIDHARLLARRALQLPASAEVAASRRCIFVVHLPPSHRMRHFAVNFERGWAYYFVDEARPDVEASVITGLSTRDLLQSSLSELCESGALSLRFLLRKRASAALAAAAAPGALPLQERARFLDAALATDPALAALVERIVVRSLATLTSAQCRTMHVPYHVELALGPLNAGSLRVSLEVAVDALLTRVLAQALAALDVNSALDVLIRLPHPASPPVASAWHALASGFVESSKTIGVCSFDGLLSGRGVQTRNTGSHGHLRARMPFSHQLQVQLHTAADAVSNRLVGQEAVMLDRMLAEAWCKAQLGEATWRAAEAFRDHESGHHLAYLHDVVLSSAAPRLAGLDATEQLELYRVVLAASCPGSLETLPGIHWAIRACETVLASLSATLAFLNVPAQRLALESASLAEEPGRVILRTVEMCAWERLARLGDEDAPPTEWTALAGRLAGLADDVGGLLASCEGHWLSLRTATALATRGYVSKALLSRLSASAGSTFDAAALRDALHDDKCALALGLQVLVGDPAASQGALDVAVELAVENELPLSVRRAIVALLCSHGAIERVLTHRPKLVVLQLVLAYCEDIGVVEPALANGSRVDKLPASFSDIRAIAAARRLVESIASQLLAAALQAADGTSGSASCMHAASTLPHGLAVVAGYGLACLHRQGGVEGVAHVFARPRAELEWLCLGDAGRVLSELVAARDNLSHQDNFPRLLGKDYEKMARAVHEGLPSASNVAQAFRGVDVSSTVKAAALFVVRLSLDRGKGGHRDLEEQTMASPNFCDDLGPWMEDPQIRLQLAWLRRGGCGPSSRNVKRQLRDAYTLDATVAQSLFALTFHVLGLAAKLPGSYLQVAVERPEGLRQIYLPAQPWDSNQMIFEAMKAESVTWYRCPKGHLYSIGECGGPVMTTRCSHPGCGAIIGGTGHTPSKGNNRLGTIYEMTHGAARSISRTGYVLGASDIECSNYSRHVERIGYSLAFESVCFHRIFLHTALLGGAEVATNSELEKLCKGLDRQLLLKRLEHDWFHLQRLTGWTSAELALVLHLAFERMERLLLDAGAGALATQAASVNFEQKVDNEIVVPLFLAPGARKAIRRETAAFQASATERIVRRQIGADQWKVMCEEADATGKAPSAEQCLWRVRTMASLDHLVAYLRSLGPGANRFPLLGAFLRHEEHLPLISCLADVLAWQRLLFRMLGSSPLSREEAAKMTNADFVATLPEGEKAGGVEVLSAFCSAFNRALLRLPNLYECQKNPFLNTDGVVDLALGNETAPRAMDADTPLHFSLPSHPPGSLVDAPGLCTIQILQLLARSHNEVSHEIAAAAARAAGASAASAETSEDAIALTVSVATPPALLRRRLVTYERQRDLVPLLFEFSEQSLEWGEGVDLRYDLVGLERAIASRLLAGKRPLALQVRHYLYAGEVRAQGGLAALQAAVPQAPALPAVVAEAARAELDTREQAVQLLALLEIAIHLLGAAGSPSLADLPLAAYLRDVAMLEAGRLEAGLPASLAQRVTLRHVRALFLFAEERVASAGSSGAGASALFPGVPPRYRSQLPEELRATLLGACAHCTELRAVLPVLRDLLTGALSDGSSAHKAGDSLKEYLTYEDADLEEEEWFERCFPPGLRLEHALEAYRAVAASLVASDGG